MPKTKPVSKAMKYRIHMDNFTSRITQSRSVIKNIPTLPKHVILQPHAVSLFKDDSLVRIDVEKIMHALGLEEFLKKCATTTTKDVAEYYKVNNRRDRKLIKTRPTEMKLIKTPTELHPFTCIQRIKQDNDGRILAEVKWAGVDPDTNKPYKTSTEPIEHVENTVSCVKKVEWDLISPHSDSWRKMTIADAIEHAIDV
jgi:hypothetical protein